MHTSPSWKFYKGESARNGLIATAYSRDMSNKNDESDRLVQITKLHLFAASSALFSCPLAMTDGAATVIRNLLTNKKMNLSLKTVEKLKNAYSHLTSTDPEQFWTSGQWMTEKRGGSDVGNATDTVSMEQKDGSYKLYGFKWFTSAIDADMTLALARTVNQE